MKKRLAKEETTDKVIVDGIKTFQNTYISLKLLLCTIIVSYVKVRLKP